ncbi:phosphatase PAP2 family protein [Trueperella pyogenes]
MQTQNTDDLKMTDRSKAHPRRWVAPAVVFAVATVVTGVLITAVCRQTLFVSYDPIVTAGALTWRMPWLTAIAQVFTFMGTALFLVPVATVLVLTLLAKRRYWAGLVATLTMLIGLGLTSLLKNLIGRNRPPANHQIGDFLGSYAFPSGHTLNTTVVIGVLAFLLMKSYPRLRSLLAILWLAQVALVGMSRIYLGYHWLTDVLGGFSIGLIVLAAGYAAALFLSDAATPATAESTRPPRPGLS